MNLSQDSLKELYQQRLLSRFWLAVILMILLGVGIISSIHMAFTHPVFFIRPDGIAIVLVWTLITGIVALFHSNNNRSIHSLENYFGYQGDRAKARHEHFCTNLLHCALVHDRIDEEYTGDGEGKDP